MFLQSTILSGWSLPGFAFESNTGIRSEHRARVPLLESVAASSWCEQIENSPATEKSAKSKTEVSAPASVEATSGKPSANQDALVTQNESLRRRVLKDAHIIYEKHLKRQAKEMQSSSETMRRLYKVVVSLNYRNRGQDKEGESVLEEIEVSVLVVTLPPK